MDEALERVGAVGSSDSVTAFGGRLRARPTANGASTSCRPPASRRSRQVPGRSRSSRSCQVANVARVPLEPRLPDGVDFTPVGGEWVDRIERELSGSFASILRRSRSPRLKRCADESCRRVFYDATRSRTRRWCDSGTCANRARVRHHRSRSAGSA